MALVDPTKAIRLEVPHEPGQWVEVRPLMGADMESLDVEAGRIKISFALLAEIVLAWSYDEPPSIDTIRRLDIDTILWLDRAALKASGVRDDDEGKGSPASSPSGTPPPSQDGASIPEPSLTS